MGEQITYSISEAIESDVSDLELIYVEKQIFDELHLTRYCCRKVLLTHVDLIEKI